MVMAVWRFCMIKSRQGKMHGGSKVLSVASSPPSLSQAKLSIISGCEHWNTRVCVQLNDLTFGAKRAGTNKTIMLWLIFFAPSSQ